ncbi:hypothetical protein ACVW0J_000024 [Bradyrhizobium sp. i1.7.7]
MSSSLNSNTPLPQIELAAAGVMQRAVRGRAQQLNDDIHVTT